MKLLGTLRTRLVLESKDFRRGLDGAKKELTSFQKMIPRVGAMAGAAIGVALTQAARKGTQALTELETAQRRAAGAAASMGVEFARVEGMARRARKEFGLSTTTALGLAEALTRLGGRAGDLETAERSMRAFLDMGAARGLDIQGTIKALRDISEQQSGANPLFAKLSPVIFSEYAKSIGTVAASLTDAQKAQAYLDLAIRNGEQVRGAYTQWLTTTAGQQFLLSQRIDETYQSVGSLFQPAIVASFPALKAFADWLTAIVNTLRSLFRSLELVPIYLKAFWKAFKDPSGAMDQLNADLEKWSEKMYAIWDPWANGSQLEPITLPPVTPPDAAPLQRFFSSLEDEWERLRHMVNLRDIVIDGTEAHRLALEETHALRLLDIEEQHIKARARLGELNAHETAGSLRQLDIRRQLATETRRQMTAAARREEQWRGMLAEGDIRLADTIARAHMEPITGNAEERLRGQLALIERVHEMQRNALLGDVRLTETERNNALLKLDLEKEREQIAARILSMTEKESESLRRRQAAIQGIQGQIASMVGAAVGGRMSGSQIGSGIGTIGSMALGAKFGAAGGPIGIAIGSALGGLVGGLFDKQNDTEVPPIIRQLEAIERAQKETVSAITSQTDELLNPQGRLFNIPASFSLPPYNPTNNVTVNIHPPVGTDMDAMRRMVENVLGETLYTQRMGQTW